VDCIELFESSLKSKETRNNYMLLLKIYTDFVRENDLFCQNDHRLIERKIIDFILHLKKEGKSFAAIHNYVASIKSFYKINDVMLNTWKISKFMPEHKRLRKDRAYTYDEISKLLDISDEEIELEGTLTLEFE